MMNLSPFKKPLVLTATGVGILLLTPAVLAHSGHAHTQLDPLSAMLHSLTTHPLLFGIVGLVFVTAVYMSRH